MPKHNILQGETFTQAANRHGMSEEEFLQSFSKLELQELGISDNTSFGLNTKQGYNIPLSPVDAAPPIQDEFELALNDIKNANQFRESQQTSFGLETKNSFALPELENIKSNRQSPTEGFGSGNKLASGFNPEIEGIESNIFNSDTFMDDFSTQLDKVTNKQPDINTQITGNEEEIKTSPPQVEKTNVDFLELLNAMTAGQGSIDQTVSHLGAAIKSKDTLGIVGGVGSTLIKTARAGLSGYGLQKREEDALTEAERKKLEAAREGYNFKKGGEVTEEMLLTQDYINGLNSTLGNTKPTINTEDGEYINQPSVDGIQEVVGDKHVDGGENLAVEGGTKVISDASKLEKQNIKYFNENYNIKVSDKDTFATVVDKYKSKIGLTKLIEEETGLLEKLKKQEETKDESTSKINAAFLANKIQVVRAEKSTKETELESFSDEVYKQQESNKPKVKEKPVSIFKEGGEVNMDTINTLSNKYGITTEEALDIYNTITLPKMLAGGEVENLSNNEIINFLKNKFKIDHRKTIDTLKNMSHVDGKELDYEARYTDDINKFNIKLDSIKDKRESLVNIAKLFDEASTDDEDNKAYIKRKAEEREETNASYLMKDEKQETNIDPITGNIIVEKEEDNSLPSFWKTEINNKEQQQEQQQEEEANVANKQVAVNLLEKTINERMNGILPEFGNNKLKSGFNRVPNNDISGITPKDFQPLIFKDKSILQQLEEEQENNSNLGTEEGRRADELSNENTQKANVIQPFQTTSPPSAMQLPTKTSIDLETIGANLVSDEKGLVEINRQVQKAMELAGRTGTAAGTAALSDILAQSLKASTEVTSQTEQINAAERKRVSEYNANVSDRQQIADANALLTYEDKVFRTMNVTDQNKRAYYDFYKKQALNNYNTQQNIDLLNKLYENYEVDPLTGEVKLRGDTKLSSTGTKAQSTSKK